MSDEEIVESQAVKDTKAFNEWFNKNIASLSSKAQEVGLNDKLAEIMRMSWRKCSEQKNQEAESLLRKISKLEDELKEKDKKYEVLHMELQKVSNKLIQAEKNAKK